MASITDFTPEQQAALNSDASLEKQARRYKPRPLVLVCKSCGQIHPAQGYMGYGFHECPVCSGELEGRY